MSNPNELRYTDKHEWARLEDGVVTVGITKHAQEALGDVVFVELPEVGASVDLDTPFGVVESVKAVSDLFSPCEGEVTEVNEALEDEPEQINADPYTVGWIMKVRPTDLSSLDGLMDAAGYEAFIKAEG